MGRWTSRAITVVVVCCWVLCVTTSCAQDDEEEATPLITFIMDADTTTVNGPTSFRLSIAASVGVSSSRVQPEDYATADGSITVPFVFSASSTTTESTSTELATQLQYILFEKSSDIYISELLPMAITSTTFDTLPDPTPTPPESNTSSSSSDTKSSTSADAPSTEVPPTPVPSNITTEPPTPTPAPSTTTAEPPTPSPPPTPAPLPTTPAPTPLAPRIVYNGSGLLFGNSTLEGDEEETSTIWLVVMGCIGILCLAGIVVCLIKVCTGKKAQEKRVYGDRI